MILCLDIKDFKGSLDRRGFEMQWNLNKWELTQGAKAQEIVTGVSRVAQGCVRRWWEPLPFASAEWASAGPIM